MSCWCSSSSWSGSCLSCITNNIKPVNKVIFDCSSCDMECDSCNILTVKKYCNGILTLWCLWSTTSTPCSSTTWECGAWTVFHNGQCVPCWLAWQIWCWPSKDQCADWFEYNWSTWLCELSNPCAWNSVPVLPTNIPWVSPSWDDSNAISLTAWQNVNIVLWEWSDADWDVLIYSLLNWQNVNTLSPVSLSSLWLSFIPSTRFLTWIATNPWEYVFDYRAADWCSYTERTLFITII